MPQAEPKERWWVMFRGETQKRRFSDHKAAGASSIGTGMFVTGNLNCEGDLIVAGTVRGESRVSGRLTLLQQGRWEGIIEASDAIIEGSIQGRIAVAGTLEIHKSANINGSVQAQSIAVAEGAVIDGTMTVNGEAPVIRFQEKRKT